MKTSIVYIYSPHGRNADHYTMRFLECYHEFPAGIDHESIVVLNGIRETSETTCLFSSLSNLRFLEHDNSGYDIGGFQHAARDADCDMIVFFGASTFFRKAGWLLRMADAFQKHGIAQYGTMGNRGNRDVQVWPHIRTTAFWMPPGLMNAYPVKVTKPDQRHPFEHSQNCFTSWVTNQGLKNWVVTWRDELLWEKWNSDPNGYIRGNQSSMIAGDRMCEAPYYPKR